MVILSLWSLVNHGVCALCAEQRGVQRQHPSLDQANILVISVVELTGTHLLPVVLGQFVFCQSAPQSSLRALGS